MAPSPEGAPTESPSGAQLRPDAAGASTARTRPGRSPWTRPRDRVVAAGLAAAVAAFAVAVVAGSDGAATESTVAAGPAAELPTPFRVPTTFTEAWRAPSDATPVPVAQGSTVVTGDDGEVVGRDPMTGRQRWRYARDVPLCTLAGEWSRAVAVHTKGSGCSEVTALDADTGVRKAQRNGDAEQGTRLLGDGAHLVTTGATLLNVWSQDLLRTMEIGALPAPVNPGKQPRSGCRFATVAVADQMIATSGPCPGKVRDRLIVFKTTNYEGNESRSDEPKELYAVELPPGPARVVAVSDPASSDKPVTAVASAAERKLLVFSDSGKRSTAYQLDLPQAELDGLPEGGVTPTFRSDRAVYWFTGSRTVALGVSDLAPRWTLTETAGTATLYAGKLIVPIRGGLAVVDEDTGRTERTIGVDRGDYAGPVRLAAAGPVLLEQRGDTLVALT